MIQVSETQQASFSYSGNGLEKSQLHLFISDTTQSQLVAVLVSIEIVAVILDVVEEGGDVSAVVFCPVLM